MNARLCRIFHRRWIRLRIVLPTLRFMWCSRCGAVR